MGDQKLTHQWVDVTQTKSSLVVTIYVKTCSHEKKARGKTLSDTGPSSQIERMFDLPKEMEDKKLIRESVLPKNSKRIRSIFILNIALPFNTYKLGQDFPEKKEILDNFLFLSILTQDKRNVEYFRGSVGPDRLPLVPVVSILSYSVEYEIGILSLLDKESSIEPGDLMISCVFLELHFFTFFSTLFFFGYKNDIPPQSSHIQLKFISTSRRDLPSGSFFHDRQFY